MGGTEQSISDWSRTFSLPWRDKANSMCIKPSASGARLNPPGKSHVKSCRHQLSRNVIKKMHTILLTFSSSHMDSLTDSLSKKRHYINIFFLRSAIYASRLYLNQYHTTHQERLATDKEGGPKIRGNVYQLK